MIAARECVGAVLGIVRGNLGISDNHGLAAAYDDTSGTCLKWPASRKTLQYLAIVTVTGDQLRKPGRPVDRHDPGRRPARVSAHGNNNAVENSGEVCRGVDDVCDLTKASEGLPSDSQLCLHPSLHAASSRERCPESQ